MKPEVRTKLYVRETDGTKTPVGENPMLSVDSHGYKDSLVVLVIDGKSYAVVASELQRAIRNASD